MDKTEKDTIAGGLSVLSEDQLDALGKSLIISRDSLDELNSLYPETRAFLSARSLTRVSQLDADGRKELEAHLQGIVDGLYRKV